MAETLQQRIARVQAILGTRFTNFKSEFLPLRDRYEEASHSWYTAGNSVPGGLEGQLGHIQYMIDTGKEPMYTTGGVVWKTVDWWDPANTNTSGWNARVVGRIEHLADRIAAHLGTTYTVKSQISSDGNFVTYSYVLVPPVDNERALAFQQALTESLGGAWPLLPDDQLRLLNQQLAAYNQAINTWEAAKISNPDSSAIFQRNIDRLEHSKEITLPWLDYVVSGFLPGEVNPEVSLSASIVEYIDEPAIDEASEVARFTADSEVLQSPEDVVSRQESDEYFANVESEDERDALAFAKEDPVIVLQSTPLAPEPVEDVREPDSTVNDSASLDVTDDAVLGSEPGFIPEPDDIPFNPRTTEVISAEDVSDEFVASFDYFLEGDLSPGGYDGSGTGTGSDVDDTVNPQNSAEEQSGIAKKAVIAAVISALIYSVV